MSYFLSHQEVKNNTDMVHKKKNITSYQPINRLESSFKLAKATWNKLNILHKKISQIYI